MTRKFYALLALAFCITTAFTFTQEGETLTEKILAKLEKYRLNTPQEEDSYRKSNAKFFY